MLQTLLLLTAMTQVSFAQNGELPPLVEYRDAIDACYEQALEDDQELTGMMEVRITADTHGDVMDITSVSISPGLHDSILEECIFATIELKRFIAPLDGGISSHNDRIRIEMEEVTSQDPSGSGTRIGTVTIVFGDYEVPVAPPSHVLESEEPPCVEDRTSLKRRKKARVAREQVVFKVVEGDTLAFIASIYGVELEDLAKWNGLCADSALKKGERVLVWLDEEPDPCLEKLYSLNWKFRPPGRHKVPEGVEPGSERVIYSPVEGEVLRDIASRYGAPIREVALWNRLSEDAVLDSGDFVIIWIAPFAWPCK